jgi:undecaprenyl-diphosphatase
MGRPLAAFLLRSRPWIIAAGAGFSLALALAPFDPAWGGFLRAFWEGPQGALAKPLFRAIQPLGKTDVLAMAALIAGLWGLKRQAVAMLLALALTAGLVLPVKALVQRERPNRSSSTSFPSGDAAAVVAAAWPLAARLPPLQPAAAAAAAGVALGRVLTGAHHPSDVAAGAAFGFVAGGLGAAAAGRLRRRLTWRHFAAAAAAMALAGIGWGAVSGRGDAVRMAAAMSVLGPLAAGALAWRLRRARRRVRSRRIRPR